MPRRSAAAVGAFLAWTLFVWVGRIRNAVADDALSAADRVGPLLLSLSFVVPAVVLSVVFWRGRRSDATGPVAWRGAWMLAAWTVGVWVVRATDITLGADHEVGFVVVHLVLAAVSIVLAVLALRTLAARDAVSARSTRSVKPELGPRTGT